MTQITRSSQPSYTPDSDRPRKRDRAWALLTKDITARDIVLFTIAALAAVGFVNPVRRIATLEARVSATEESIRSLAEQQRFTNYMLCVNARRTDPASAPPDCAPLIEARTPK